MIILWFRKRTLLRSARLLKVIRLRFVPVVVTGKRICFDRAFFGGLNFRTRRNSVERMLILPLPQEFPP